MAKTYYWLKLPEDFFDNLEIAKLRSVPSGDTFTIIYLKLLLSSLNDNGYLQYHELCDTFAEEVALLLHEDPKHVEFTVNFLLNTGLMEQKTETVSYLTRISEMVGKETDKAALMRKKREQEKLKAPEYEGI